MKMKLRLLCTESTKGSRSLKDLASVLTNQLGYKVWRSINPRPNRDNIKYGQPSNKLHQYRWFQEQGIPSLEFTADENLAADWVESGETVFGRKLLNSSCGKGIVVFNPDDGPSSVTNCPVYTKYKKKKREFRVHVFRNKVVRIVEKKLRKDWSGPRDSKIRNLANGFVFCDCVDPPAGIHELALKAAQVSPSDFRGVDIGYNEKKEELFVIEVNSAPGIQGSNLQKYVEAILNV